MANQRILIVDDEKGVVRSCVRILERDGFIAVGKSDSESVPELLQHETFDILLTDIRMPKMDGLKLLEIAKEIDPYLTVILITGYGTMEDAIRAIRLGAEGFILKPFEPADLIATIQDSLKRRKLVRDSLRLETLLPLLEFNRILQVSGGETSLAVASLEIVQRQTKAARLAWLSYQPPSIIIAEQATDQADPHYLIEMASVHEPGSVASQLPEAVVKEVLISKSPMWLLKDGSTIDRLNGQANVVGALLPLIIKGEVAGILTAETGDHGRAGPFDQISLDLLSLLAWQLSLIIENVQLFQQTETLRAFNDNIINTITNGLIAIDQRGYLTAFNPAAAAILGKAQDEVLHRPLDAAIDNARELVDTFFEVLQSGQPQAHKEVIAIHWDGNQIPLALSVAPLVHPENAQPTGAVGILEDLSEIKNLENERRRLDRLAALGEMSAVVAHEIRNPVAGIAAGVEYITRKAPKGSTDYEGALMIQKEIKRVNRILEDILFVARPLQLNISQEDLVAIIDGVIQQCQPQLRQSNLSVTLQHASKLPPIQADRQRLEQVFSNLIINATQAIQGGELSLRTRLISALNGRATEAVEITLADSGPGIPPDISQRIFEPFFTTKTRGTGLGLTVARRIIEEHRGTIRIETQSNHGTCFIIQLPTAQAVKP